MLREIILDTETTGLYVDDGDRLISIGMVEMIDGRETGVKLHVIVNPERDSHPEALKVHRMTPEFLSRFPAFADHAEEIRRFIGDDPVIITCRTTERDGNPYVLDKEFLNAELIRAGVEPLKEQQWVNVRLWSEEMFGHKAASLDNILNRYRISKTGRDKNGHGALLDAELLAAAYPQLKADYFAFKTPAAAPLPPHP